MQARHAARLMVVFLLWEATDEPERYFPDLLLQRVEGRLTNGEQHEIMDQMIDIAQDLLGTDIRFNNIGEIMNYLRNS